MTHLTNSLIPVSGVVAMGTSVLMILISQDLTHRFGIRSCPERWLLILRASLLILAGTLATDGFYLLARHVYYCPISIVREASLAGVALSVLRLIQAHKQGRLPPGIFTPQRGRSLFF